MVVDTMVADRQILVVVWVEWGSELGTDRMGLARHYSLELNSIYYRVRKRFSTPDRSSTQFLTIFLIILDLSSPPDHRSAHKDQYEDQNEPKEPETFSMNNFGKKKQMTTKIVSTYPKYVP